MRKGGEPMEEPKRITLVRKLRLVVATEDKDEVDRVYRFLRDARYAQNKAYNILLSRIYCAYVNNEGQDAIKEIWKRGERTPKKDDPDWSLYNGDEIRFATGTSTASSVGEAAKKAFAQQKRNGLLSGKVALANKKLTAPLLIKNQLFSFYHEYESLEEACKRIISDAETRVYMKFVNNCVFKVLFGRIDRSMTLRKEMCRVLDDTYKIQGSSIDITEEGKIILNLSVGIPVSDSMRDESKVVGVDLGMAVPAVCALNDGQERCYIGSIDELLRVRTQIQSEIRKLQKSLASTAGGHGRKKKLKHLEALKEREANFVRTYNHMVSRRTVDFALKNNAGVIQLEDLSGFSGDRSEYVLRNWSYYQLQSDISYKASIHGIKVRKVDPAYTSQTCSLCGHYEPGQRISQKAFVCKNPECSGFGKEVNADYNAARNIAKSGKIVL